MFHLEDASKVREIVDREVLQQDPKLISREPKLPSLLRTLVSESAKVASLALGDTGSRLRVFAQAVEGSIHPDICDIKDGIFADDHEFSVISTEMVKLVALASEAKLDHVLPHIGKIVSKAVPSVSSLKEIDDPDKTLNYVRFVSERVRRDSIRRQKKTQTVNLQTILSKNPDQWSSCGKSFLSLARNQTPFIEDISLCSRRSKGFSDIGASGLAARMADRVMEFEAYSQEKYYGFNRLTVTLGSIIAGKILGCDLQPTPMRSCRVAMPQSSANEIFKILGETNPTTKSSQILYEPRLYPIHALEELMSERTRLLIELLESFPEASGCPIFDHYWCLVPSLFVLNIPASYGKGANDVADVTGSFDRAVLKANAVPAILLGEKDGKSYFVDYFYQKK